MLLGNIFDDKFKLSDFNNFLREKSKNEKDKCDEVNFIKFISCDKNKMCSVVCEIQSAEDNINKPFVFLSKEKDKDGKDQYIECKNFVETYYGLNPKIDTSCIIEAIKNKRFKSLKSTNEFVQDNNNMFMLHAPQKDYLKPLFIYVIIRFSTLFGINFYFHDDDTKNKFIKDIIETNEGLFVNNVTIKMKNENDKSIIFLGNVHNEILNILNKNKYDIYHDKDKDRLFIEKHSEKKDLIKFSKFYEDEKLLSQFLHLVQGKVFYSGVLPRLLKIERTDSCANSDIQTLRLYIEKTTFATVDAFDFGDIIKHPIFNENCKESNNIKNIITDIFKSEKELRDQYIFEKDEEECLNPEIKINNYLSNSIFTNTIAVSGNIITSDNYLIYTQRNKDMIDGGKVYCSVNGQSEIYDQNVSFYKCSVYEDEPTLKFVKGFRIDFQGELDRETVAELGISDIMKWKYYGISVLGINNNAENIENNKRRLHFNVLAQGETAKTLKETVISFKEATEKFENYQVYGLKLYNFENPLELLSFKVKVLLEALVKRNALLTAVFALLYLFLELTKNKESVFFLNNLSSFLLSGSVLLFSITQIGRQIKEFSFSAKHKNKIETTCKKKDKEIMLEEIINKISKKMKPHPIFLLMLSIFALHNNSNDHDF